MLFQQGCIVAPNINKASVLDQNELKIVTYIQRGKDYTLSGRLDAAELVLRKAVRLVPKNPTVLNDLGYVLHAQLRFSEALHFYMEALDQDPLRIETKQNLARLFFDSGDYEQALLRYLDLLNYYVELEAQTKQGQTNELMLLNRSLAQIYYHQGDLDEAICYSSKTFLFGAQASPDQFTQHVRMLMSANIIDSAKKMLQNYIASAGGETPERLLQDYGILLYYSGDYQLAAEAFARVLSAGQDYETKRTALLYKYLLALKNQQKEEAQFIFTTVLEEDPTLCKDADFDFFGYWPHGLEEEMAKVVAAGCVDAS